MTDKPFAVVVIDSGLVLSSFETIEEARAEEERLIEADRSYRYEIMVTKHGKPI